ncbi:MAG: 6-oxocyclohex-1-ene-1-carbonyl-CoA hydratase [Deltaproteobacteria bacterium]|nr:6-oxocyclohex-1-ene-1-carbonyl-CoA hydratase [Deltaproteobacteria bacterium]
MPNHELVSEFNLTQVRYEKRPCLDHQGKEIDGLYQAWIILDNPTQFNSYNTDMVKSVILAFRKAGMESDVMVVIFTAVGEKAFCTGGNTKEYAEVYAGRPDLYSQYMCLFNDMVTQILMCDKPVICRVNGMRIGGGQEIGMACDFSIASDLARFGQAGPKHGSAPDGGSTDFLPLFVGIEEAILSCTACVPWSAHKAKRLGLITDLAPALKIDGEFVANPLVHTDEWLDKKGEIIYGEPKTGTELETAKARLKKGEIDLSLLDEKTQSLAYNLLMTMPGCLIKTLQSLRKHKLLHWDKNKESNRAWLSLNMMTEANLGFRAFNEGPKHRREVDFIELRKRLSKGERWDREFIDSLIPKA